MTGQDPDGQHGPHVVAASFDELRLHQDDRHHLGRVVRLRDGDRLTVGDGDGRWRPCRWGAEIQPDGDVVTVAARTPRIGVAFALIKGGRPELVVQKLVELGVDDIYPFTADRSVVRWDEAKAEKNGERLARVAREAVGQCRRAWLPVVHPLRSFAEVAAVPGACRADRGGQPISIEFPVVLVGPEGGWSDQERALALPVVALSTAVLRAETAAIAAATLLAAGRDLTPSA